jgi:hypothetical protein
MGVKVEIQAVQLELLILKRTQFLYPEGGSHNFLKNTGYILQVYKLPHPRRLQS